jgi:hypothetical protein
LYTMIRSLSRDFLVCVVFRQHIIKNPVFLVPGLVWVFWDYSLIIPSFTRPTSTINKAIIRIA